MSGIAQSTNQDNSPFSKECHDYLVTLGREVESRASNPNGLSSQEVIDDPEVLAEVEIELSDSLCMPAAIASVMSKGLSSEELSIREVDGKHFSQHPTLVLYFGLFRAEECRQLFTFGPGYGSPIGLDPGVSSEVLERRERDKRDSQRWGAQREQGKAIGEQIRRSLAATMGALLLQRWPSTEERADILVHLEFDSGSGYQYMYTDEIANLAEYQELVGRLKESSDWDAETLRAALSHSRLQTLSVVASILGMSISEVK